MRRRKSGSRCELRRASYFTASETYSCELRSVELRSDSVARAAGRRRRERSLRCLFWVLGASTGEVSTSDHVHGAIASPIPT